MHAFSTHRLSWVISWVIYFRVDFSLEGIVVQKFIHLCKPVNCVVWLLKGACILRDSSIPPGSIK